MFGQNIKLVGNIYKMIKFFRKTRQKLLSENKVSKYLVYAIGEIVLVVIGILIALQINNWNETNKKRSEETILLEALRQDFIENEKRLTTTMTYQKGMIDYSNGLISSITGNTIKTIDSDSILKLKAFGANSWFRAELVNSTFETIISSGKGDIIQNLNLKKKLVDFSTDLKSGFEDDYESKECIVFMNNISFEHEVNFLDRDDQESFGITIPKDSIRKSFNSLFSNRSYLGALINKTGIESSRLDYQKKLYDQVDEILKEINSEIQ